jgi:hypothetical protein
MVFHDLMYPDFRAMKAVRPFSKNFGRPLDEENEKMHREGLT